MRGEGGAITVTLNGRADSGSATTVSSDFSTSEILRISSPSICICLTISTSFWSCFFTSAITWLSLWFGLILTSSTITTWSFANTPTSQSMIALVPTLHGWEGLVTILATSPHRPPPAPAQLNRSHCVSGSGFEDGCHTLLGALLSIEAKLGNGPREPLREPLSFDDVLTSFSVVLWWVCCCCCCCCRFPKCCSWWSLNRMNSLDPFTFIRGLSTEPKGEKGSISSWISFISSSSNTMFSSSIKLLILLSSKLYVKVPPSSSTPTSLSSWWLSWLLLFLL